VTSGSDEPMTAAPALELEGVSKAYPGVQALDAVSFTVYHGEIHALLGENGAGKSTLVKLVMGATRPDGGVIRINGEPVHLRSPRDARRHGVTMIPQEVDTCRELSVGRNILLGREARFVRRQTLTGGERRTVEDALTRIGAHIDLRAAAGELNVPTLRLAQIAHSIVTSSQIVLCDEATAVLSESDAEAFLTFLVKSKSDKQGAIVYVTHRLGEVLQIADRVTVLRDGRVVGTFARSEVDRPKLIDLMTKSDPQRETARRKLGLGVRPRRAGKLQIDGLSFSRVFTDVSLEVESGSVVGLAGVQGAGHGALLSAIAGRRPYEAGAVVVDGRELARGSTRAACRAGIELVPADRRHAAIVARRSLRENIALPVTGALATHGFRRRAVESRVARTYSEAFGIRSAGIGTLAGELSGGNQQKLALARVVQGAPRFLLLEEPTQGIDVAGKAEVRRLIARLVEEEGVGVLVASSEFEDLLGFASTIHVMRLGRIVATLDGETATYAQLLHEALP